MRTLREVDENWREDRNPKHLSSRVLKKFLRSVRRVLKNFSNSAPEVLRCHRTVDENWREGRNHQETEEEKWVGTWNRLTEIGNGAIVYIGLSGERKGYVQKRHSPLFPSCVCTRCLDSPPPRFPHSACVLTTRLCVNHPLHPDTTSGASFLSQHTAVLLPSASLCRRSSRA